MTRTYLLLATLFCLLAAPAVRADHPPLTPVAADVNKRLVKLYGAGGFKGLASYGTGILVSPKGHILTINNHIVSSQNIRVHLYDGRAYQAKLVFREPELDVAILRIEEDVDFLPHFDFDKAAARPAAEPGDTVMAFSNCYQIATRDEPMTVQRGIVAARTELKARKGVFDAPFVGEVYYIDTITGNPGSAGGALTTRKGELIGVLGRELKSNFSNTWINYAVPIVAIAEIQRDGKPEKVSMARFVKESIDGKYKQGDDRNKEKRDKGGFHGIVLVVNAVPSTPPFVEEVLPNSPAAKAGMKPDDLIVYVNGNLINSIKEFRDVMRLYGPTDEPVRFEVQRGNRLESLSLKLTEHPKVKAAK